MQSSTTPDAWHHMGKWQKLNITYKQEVYPFQAWMTTRLQLTGKKAWQTRNINNRKDSQKKHRLGHTSDKTTMRNLITLKTSNCIFKSGRIIFTIFEICKHTIREYFCLNIEHQEVTSAMYTVLMLRYVKMSVRRLLADHRHTKSNQHGIDVWLLKI